MKKSIFLFIFLTLFFHLNCQRKKQLPGVNEMVQTAQTTVFPKVLEDAFETTASAITLTISKVFVDQKPVLGQARLDYSLDNNVFHSIAVVFDTEGYLKVALPLKMFSKRGNLTLYLKLNYNQKNYILPSTSFVWKAFFSEEIADFAPLELIYPSSAISLASSSFSVQVRKLPPGSYLTYYQIVQGSMVYQKKLGLKQIVMNSSFSIDLIDEKEFLAFEDKPATMQWVFIDIENKKWRSSIQSLSFNAPAQDWVLIQNTADLEKIRENLQGKFKLTADIDLNGQDFSPIGSEDKPFEGIFEGDGHWIKNWTYQAKDDFPIGFFASLSFKAIVKNLGFSDINLEAKKGAVGVLAGIGGGKISGLWIEKASLKGDKYIGSVLGHFSQNGYIHFSQITQIYLEGAEYIGGFVGSNQSARAQLNIESSLFQGVLKGNQKTGLFAGQWSRGDLRYSYVLGAIESAINSPKEILIGEYLGSASFTQVYGYGKHNTSILLDFYDLFGQKKFDQNTFQMKKNILNWSLDYPDDLRIWNQKLPSVPFSKSKRFFLPGAVQMPAIYSTQFFPQLFFAPLFAYNYDQKDDCSLSQLSQYPQISSLFSSVFMKPDALEFTNYLPLQKIRFYPWQQDLLSLEDAFAQLGVDFILDLNAKTIGFPKEKIYCQGEWERWSLQIEPLVLNFSLWQEKETEKFTYSLELEGKKAKIGPIFEDYFLESTPLVWQNGSEVILHIKEGSGLVPREEVLSGGQTAFFYNPFPVQLPKKVIGLSLVILGGDSFTLPLEIDFKKSGATLNRLVLDQKNNPDQEVIFKGQKMSVALSFDPVILKDFEGDPGIDLFLNDLNSSALKKGDVLDLKTGDVLYVLSEDRKTKQRFEFELQNKYPALELSLEKAMQNQKNLPFQNQKNLFLIKKINKQQLSQYPLKLDFLVKEGVQVYVQDQLQTLNQNRFSLTTKEEKEIILSYQNIKQSYLLKFSYLSETVFLQSLDLLLNGVKKEYQIDQANQQIMVYDLALEEKLKIQNLKANSLQDGSGIDLSLSTNADFSHQSFLSLFAEDQTEKKYQFIFVSSQLIVPATWKLKDLKKNDFLKFKQNPPATAFFIFEIQDKSQGSQSFQKNIQKSSFSLEDLLPDFVLTQGNLKLALYEKPGVLLEKKNFSYDLSSIENKDELLLLNYYTKAEAILTADIDLENTSFVLHNFLGSLDGNGYQIKNFSLSSVQKKIGIFTYDPSIVGKVILKNLYFNKAYVSATQTTTEHLALLFPIIPTGLSVEISKSSFVNLRLAQLIPSAKNLFPLPTGVIAGEVLGQLKIQKTTLMQVILLAKSSYLGLLVGKAKNMDLNEVAVVGIIEGRQQDISTFAQKYMGIWAGLWEEGRAENSFAAGGILLPQNTPAFYYYLTNRLGLFAGEIKNVAFQKVYGTAQIYFQTIGEKLGLHLLPSTLVLPSSSFWNNKPYKSQSLLPFSTNPQSEAISPTGTFLSNWQLNSSAFCQIFGTWLKLEISLLPNQKKLCIPISNTVEIQNLDVFWYEGIETLSLP